MDLEGIGQAGCNIRLDYAEFISAIILSMMIRHSVKDTWELVRLHAWDDFLKLDQTNNLH